MVRRADGPKVQRSALVSWARSPTPAQPLRGGRPLDPERPANDPARPGPAPEPETSPDAAPEPAAGSPAAQEPLAGPEPVAGPGPAKAPPEPLAGPEPAKAPPAPPPGIRAQAGATKEAVLGFVRAHIDLAKAELEEIKGEVARAAALGGAAIASVILLSLLLAIGGMLFAGEWIFGSIGWGVLLGAELLIAVAVTAVLVAIRVPGLGRDVALALLLGVIAGLILGFNLPNELFRRIGEALNLGVDPAVRPLLVGVVLLGLIGAVVGLVIGVRAGGGGQGAIGGLVAGLVVGVLAGAFLSITFGLRVGAALGVAVFLLAWPILEGLRVQRQGVDVEALKARFYPAVTIDTAKESIEWAKARVPRGPRS